MNEQTIIGHVGAVNTYQKCVKFSVVTMETYKDKSGESQVVTEWHKCTAFNIFFYKARVLGPGDRVMVRGRPKTSKYIDKKDGIEKYSHEILVAAPWCLLERIYKKNPKKSEKVSDGEQVDPEETEVTTEYTEGDPF